MKGNTGESMFAAARFIAMINKLGEFSEEEIKPFSKATRETWEKFLFYDENEKTKDGLFKIVDTAIIAHDYQHILTYYGEWGKDHFDIGIKRSFNEIGKESFVIECHFPEYKDEGFFVSKLGRWSFEKAK